MSKITKLVEVVFKGERRGIFRNRMDIEINEGDWVIVEADRGQDLGRVSLIGSLVRLKRGKGEAKGIVRKAVPEDLQVRDRNDVRELDAYKVCKTKIRDYRLDMKLVDVEMQFDGSKITFFFTSAQRVDFRELVKDLASVYRTRIELRQIGVRDEAKRIGGCGICGRKQCCSAFLAEFEQITTQMAKDQQLALNPAKISGNCGRLLCCLRYEESLYQEAYKCFPPPDCRVTCAGKKGMVSYIDVFKNVASVRFEDGTEDKLGPEHFQKGPEHNAAPAQ